MACPEENSHVVSPGLPGISPSRSAEEFLRSSSYSRFIWLGRSSQGCAEVALTEKVDFGLDGKTSPAIVEGIEERMAVGADANTKSCIDPGKSSIRKHGVIKGLMVPTPDAITKTFRHLFTSRLLDENRFRSTSCTGQRQ